MSKTAVAKIEMPKFENPRMTMICMEFNDRLDKGDFKGALQEVSGCSGNGSGMLIAYAIERFDAAGASEQADILRNGAGISKQEGDKGFFGRFFKK